MHDIRAYNSAELEVLLKEQAAELASMKFNHKLSPLENPAKMRDIRKDIARIQTELNARKSAQ